MKVLSTPLIFLSHLLTMSISDEGFTIGKLLHIFFSVKIFLHKF